MINKIKSKYFTYVPGEFMPVYSGDELINKREFHRYKMRRAAWMIRNHRLVIEAYTHQRG